MSNLGDELILGPETGRAHDSDGDGVSDVQEGLDGTDPNDPNSLLRRVTTGIGSDDPRGHLDGPNGLGHEVIDVTTGMPAGKSIEQNLPTGLDGTAIPTTHNHYGNADADKMFGERTGTDANSPLNMNRDPLSGNASTPGSPGGPGAAGLGDTDKGVVTSAGPASDLKSFSGNDYSTPPAGADLSFRAPNSGLVSNPKVGGKEIPDFKEGTQRPYNVEPPGKAEMQNFDKEPPSWWEQKKAEWKQLFGGNSSDGMDNLGAAGDKKTTMVDPDSGVGDAGTPSADEIERALAVAGGATDFV